MNKIGRYKLTAQSDTDSGHSGRRTDPGGTSMQTFSEGIEESPERETRFNHIEKRNTKLYTSVSSDGPYASVSKPSYYSDNGFTSGETGNSEQTNNRTSSFRPPKVKNPYASYDSLDFEEPDLPPNNSDTIMQTSTISKSTTDDFPPPPPPELLGNPPMPPPPLQNPSHEPYQQSAYQNGAIDPETEVLHYTINDDDYAIVQKPKRKPQNVPRSNQAHNPMYGQVPPSASNRTNSPYDGNKTDDIEIEPQKRPEINRSHSPKRHQTGYLPEHHCMLECDGNHPHNFPPPAQMNRQRVNGNAYPINTQYSPDRTENYY